MIEAALVYPLVMLTQGVLSIYNTNKNIKNQNELATKNQEFQQLLESNRENFQIKQFEKTQVLQRELTLLNHELRLNEQNENFNNLIKSQEWKFFLDHWPLSTAPSVLRDEVFLKGSKHKNDTVALRIILTRNDNLTYNKYLQASIEQELRKFTNRSYYQALGSHPVYFYSGGWKNIGGGGGAANANLHYGLKGLPTLVIDPNVVNDKIYFNIAIWGLGVEVIGQEILFEIPFKKMDGNVDDKEYYSEFAKYLQKYFNYTIGWFADAYHLIEYNKMPILPGILERELNQEEYKSLFHYFGKRYQELYNIVLGDQPIEIGNRNVCFKDIKTGILPETRVDYAKRMQAFGNRELVKKQLFDSIKAWLALRSKKLIWENINDIGHMFTYSDLAFIEKLLVCFRGINDLTNIQAIETIISRLRDRAKVDSVEIKKESKNTNETEKLFIIDNNEMKDNKKRLNNQVAISNNIFNLN